MHLNRIPGKHATLATSGGIIPKKATGVAETTTTYGDITRSEEVELCVAQWLSG